MICFSESASFLKTKDPELYELDSESCGLWNGKPRLCKRTNRTINTETQTTIYTQDIQLWCSIWPKGLTGYPRPEKNNDAIIVLACSCADSVDSAKLGTLKAAVESVELASACKIVAPLGPARIYQSKQEKQLMRSCLHFNGDSKLWNSVKS